MTAERRSPMTGERRWIRCARAVRGLVVCFLGVSALLTLAHGRIVASPLSVNITALASGSATPVEIGGWYKLSSSTGWVFRPAVPIHSIELALYATVDTLTAGDIPFAGSRTRASGFWPDGPENEEGDLGYEASPNVLGDHNGYLYGKPHYQSLRLTAGELSPDSIYQVTFSTSSPSHIWVHPRRSDYFTMPVSVLQSPETTLQDAVYGPALVDRQLLDPETTSFEYTGLLPGSATGLKDDYPVGEYGQRPGSHGNGDFGWFPGYALRFTNDGPDAVFVALFVTTGFTGPSGAPSNDLANDTFWKSTSFYIAPNDSLTAGLDFDRTTGFALVDNPFPHTAGGEAAPNGSPASAVNVFDRLQVSAIGWEVRSGTGSPANATLIVRPAAAGDPAEATAVRGGTPVVGIRINAIVPNPAGSSVRIGIFQGVHGPTSVAIFDVRGRLVKTIFRGESPPGNHHFEWKTRDHDGRTVASGIYFVKLSVSGSTDTRKIIVLR